LVSFFSALLAEGYALHGSPSLTYDLKQQSVIAPKGSAKVIRRTWGITR